jgi:hypothetical protein
MSTTKKKSPSRWPEPVGRLQRTADSFERQWSRMCMRFMIIMFFML